MQGRISRPPSPQCASSNSHIIDATAFAMFATVVHVYLSICQKQNVGQKLMNKKGTAGHLELKSGRM